MPKVLARPLRIMVCRVDDMDEVDKTNVSRSGISVTDTGAKNLLGPPQVDP